MREPDSSTSPTDTDWLLQTQGRQTMGRVITEPHVHLSYDFAADAARAELIRQMGVVATDAPLERAQWHAMVNSASAFESWADGAIGDKDALVVLVGTRTSTRPRIHYEIARALDLGKPVLGVRVDRLMVPGGGACARGLDPFAALVWPTRLHAPSRPRLHDTDPNDAYACIRHRLVSWITAAWQAEAARQRRAVAALEAGARARALRESRGKVQAER